ncbi:MAG TPA: RagB/SusD family nutrient uptake outer membrane protein [Gemmatimonadaceae bacterium]|nr:RagB/SusD family nutrient uptake outer membrane protein [Gemmatimonadaceae bacterium]
MKTTTQFRPAALAAIVICLTLNSCNDAKYLTETPLDFVGPQNFYRTAGDALAAINGVYASFINTSGDNYYGRNFVMLVEHPTEMWTSRLSATNERSQPDVYTIPVTHAYVQSVWASAYDAINRANSVIRRVPGIAMDTGLRSRIVAEARFLRATHYFNLVRMYGGVPLKLTETQGLDSIQLPRNTAQDVYAQIVQDLLDAIKVLPSSKSYGSADRGRASRGAAKTLLAKVYLQRAGAGGGTPADWQASLDMSKQVVADGDYALVADPMTLFDFYGGTVVENNSEIIFDIRNSRAPGLGGRISSHIAPNATAPYLGASTNGSFEAESTYFASFSPSDKRRDATFLLSWNRNGTIVTYVPNNLATSPYASETPFPRKFLDPLMTGTGAEKPNYIILRYAEVLLMIAEAANEVASGPTAEAYASINQIRARAGLPNVTPGLGHDLFRDSVFVERRWELTLEGPNGYFDSQRNWPWAKARIEFDLMKARSNSSKFPKFNGAPIPDKYKLMPIPQRALDLNPKLTQNPGW